MKHDPDSIFWEARYEDGSVLRQLDGHYKDIDRSSIESMALTYDGTDLLSVHISSALRDRFFWRRRTKVTQGGPATVHFLIGYFPKGPIHILDSDTGQVYTGQSDELHDIVDFSMPTPHPHEGETG
jgi:hypothetical protein